MSERAGGREKKTDGGGSGAVPRRRGNAVAGAHLSLMASRPALACLPASARSARIFCARTSAVCPKGRCSTIAPARRDTEWCRRVFGRLLKRLAISFFVFVNNSRLYIHVRSIM